MSSDFGIVQKIGEAIRGPIIDCMFVLLDGLENVKNEDIRESAEEEINNLIEQMSEVGAMLENFDAYDNEDNEDYDE